MHPSQYLERRNRLLATMKSGIAIIPAAAMVTRSADTHYVYRPDSYFYYLSGCTEPESVIVLIAGAKPRQILFCRPRDPVKEIWGGGGIGPHAASDKFGFDEGVDINEFSQRFSELLVDQYVIWFSLGHDDDWDRKILAGLKSARSRARLGNKPPADFHDVRLVLDEMRLFKDEQELSVIRKVADISVVAQRRAMRQVKPGCFEFELEAELLYEWRKNGCQAPAYTPIVASGANACVLHYCDNSARCASGELVLMDAGGELNGYCADITRCFPVSGRFSGPQRDIYELVLSAQHAAIAAMQAGQSFNAPHQAVLQVLIRGLLDLGLLTGSFDAVLETKSYQQFFMHRTSHWLGLDVHDVGLYGQEGSMRNLEPNMVLTVEPGCYIRPAENVPEVFWNIGVRIEDDVLISVNGPEVLTAALERSIADIEALVCGKQ